MSIFETNNFAITLSLKPKVKLESEVNLPKEEG